METTQTKKVNVDQVLESILDYKVSDIHIRENKPVYIRLPTGNLKFFDQIVVPTESLKEFIDKVLGQQAWDKITSGFEMDGVYQVRSYRFRINAFLADGGVSLALRKIPTFPLALEDIGLNSPVIMRLLQKSTGLILVT